MVRQSSSQPMKTTLSPLKAILLVLLPVLCAPVHGQTTSTNPAVAVDRTEYFYQSGATSPSTLSLPFSLNFNIRGTAQDTTGWKPAFYKPGTGETPQTGPSSATNTGTVNFST